MKGDEPTRKLDELAAKTPEETDTVVQRPEDTPTIRQGTPAGDSSVASRPTGRNAFSPGDLIAQRYRVVRLLGFGGMGEVYDVEDLELKERVALKTIRSEIAASEGVIDRFKREAQMARRVTHPNVCRIFDVGFHPQNGSSITFVTMELLSGVTLNEYLREKKPLSTDEALPLVRQMAQGLSAAHEVGIVHRDFKSPNVMLIATSRPYAKFRVVVTDFGLARLTEAEGGFAAAVTSTGGVVGTPAYMAPEQVDGSEITAAADIYAFGIVMYEMVTGKLPFTGATPLSIAAKRLKEPPPPPRIHAPSLPEKWESVILKCLEREPSHRFASAMDVVAALETSRLPLPTPTGEQSAVAKAVPQRRKLALVAGALAAVVLVATVWLLWNSTLRDRFAAQPATSSARAPVALRQAVAVFGFDNLSRKPDVAWLSTALSEMLTSELAAGEKLRTVPGQSVARVKQELQIAESTSLAKDTLTKLRANLGADFVVLGSYYALGDAGGGQIRLDMRIQNTAGETVASGLVVNGFESEMLDLVTRAGGLLREKLGIGPVSGSDAASVRAELPSNPEAARLYAQGLERLRFSDALRARDLLIRTAEIDPKYPLVHAALSDAWRALGYDTKAREEAKKAFDLSSNLSREQRSSIEARYRVVTAEWDKAIEIYRTLTEWFPDSLDYGLGLANALTNSGRGAQALKTLEALRALPPPAGTDPRIWLTVADAAGALGDYRQQRAAAAQAAEVAAKQGASQLLARAKAREGVAATHLGDAPAALSSLQQAKTIYESAKDEGRAAQVLVSIASVHLLRGEADTAKTMYQQALNINQRIGDEGSVAATLHNLAEVFTQQGDLDSAKQMYERALEIDLRTGNRRGEAQTRNQLGAIFLMRGEWRAAKTMLEESLAQARLIGDRAAIATAQGNLGNLFYQLGDRTRARAAFEETLRVSHELAVGTVRLRALSDLAGLMIDEGNLTEARTKYEEALALARKIGDKTGEASALSNLAVLLSHLGDIPAARRHFEQATTVWKATEDAFFSAYTMTDYADLLCLQGDLARCRSQHEATLATRRKIGDTAAIDDNRLGLVFVSLEEGHASAAEKTAREVAKAANLDELTDRELRAQILLTRALLAQNKLKEAEAASRRAMELAEAGSPKSLQLTAGIVAARVAAARGKKAEALAQLGEIQKETASRNWVSLDLEARLAMAQIQQAAGQLRQIASEAKAKQFGLIARKAS